MNPSEERNAALNKIAKNLEKGVVIESRNQKNKKTFVITIFSQVIAVVSIIAVIIVPFISYKLDSINKPLVLGEKINLYFDDENNGNINIEFDIEQGGLKKAYIANWEYDGCVVYENIIEDLDGKALSVSRKSCQEKINRDGKNVTFSNDDANEIYLLDGYINMRYMEDFSLVLLDTTDQWWIYYFVSSPEFIPDENIEYSLKLQDEDGKEILNVESEIKRQKMSYVIIDGTLTSVSSIEKALAKLNKDYCLFDEPTTFKGKNGIKITSNPIMKDIYNPPISTNVYDKILEIHKDIIDLSL